MSHNGKVARLARQKFQALIFCFSFLGAGSDVEAGQKIAEIINVRGQVEVLAASGQHRVLSIGSQLEERDTVVTGSDGRAKILFVEGENEVFVGTGTRLQIKSAGTNEKNAGTSLFLESGEVRSSVNRKYSGRGKDIFEVRTPNVVAGVRGTVFQVGYNRSSTVVATLEGVVAVQAGSAPALLVSAGQFTMTTRGFLQDIRSIERDPVIQKQLKRFEKSIPSDTDSSRLGNPSAKQSALANSAATAAGFRPSSELREAQSARDLSQKFGFPVDSTFNFVKSDAVTEADKARAIRELGAESGSAISREDLGDFDSVKSPSFVQPSIVSPTLTKTTYETPVLRETTDLSRELSRQRQSLQKPTLPKPEPLKFVEPAYPKPTNY